MQVRDKKINNFYQGRKIDYIKTECVKLLRIEVKNKMDKTNQEPLRIRK